MYKVCVVAAPGESSSRVFFFTRDESARIPKLACAYNRGREKYGQGTGSQRRRPRQPVAVLQSYTVRDHVRVHRGAQRRLA